MMELSQRQSIEAQLSQLANRFSHAIDNGRYEEVAMLFTEDGIFDRAGQLLSGRAAILDAMQHRHLYTTRHVVSTLLFARVEASEAAATMYVLNFVGQPFRAELPVLFALPEPAVLEFDDLYRRTGDEWLIARRTARVIMKSEVAPAH
jgi:hypothetical protein